MTLFFGVLPDRIQCRTLNDEVLEPVVYRHHLVDADPAAVAGSMTGFTTLSLEPVVSNQLAG